jgi:hypothetical protein
VSDVDIARLAYLDKSASFASASAAQPLPALQFDLTSLNRFLNLRAPNI